MKHNIFSFTLLFVLQIPVLVAAQEVLQWGGADRNGIYNETGLLKYWPDPGPEILWEFNGLGNGYGSPVITRKNIFINGEIDTVSYLFALDFSGKLLWKARIGKEWIQNYPGSRSTPTVSGDLVYVTTGMGQVACFDANTGNEKWTVNMVTDFHGPLPRFGYSESLLVDGNMIFCSPGNHDTNVVALDRFTGKLVWISKGVGEMTSYCSPMMIRLPQLNILVTFSKTNLLGIDARDSKLLWSYKQEGQDIDCQVNTPIYENGFIYDVAGNGTGKFI